MRIRLMMSIYKTGVEVVVPPRKNASTRRGHPARL